MSGLVPPRPRLPRHVEPIALPALILVALTVVALVATSGTRRVPVRSAALAQLSTATPTAVPGPPPPPIAGRWSVTRTWLRRCPACGAPVTLTTDWTIRTDGGAVTVERGPRGWLAGDGAGGGLLSLDGPESAAGSVLRFRYGTLRVAPDGRRLEGGFGGSERGPNPCGPTPPTVTCFADAGWLFATRIDLTPPPAGPSPPGPPTAVPAPATPTTAPATATSTGSPTPDPSPTATSTAAASATGTATATAPATATARPLWLPVVGDGR